MVEIKWTLQSLDDIETIADYIAKDSHFYAQMFVVKTFESVASLQTFPESGRIVPEINRKNIRELIQGNYRIIYRLKINLVEILSVYHSSRLLNAKSVLNKTNN